MAAPVEVGARATVGSLVLREVEYFRRMEVAGAGGGKKKSSSKVGAATDSGGGASSRRSSSKKPKPTTKKKGSAGAGNGSFLPRMCSSADVAAEDPGSGRRERPCRVRYRPLGDAGDALPEQD